jgi:hypothetical protein
MVGMVKLNSLFVSFVRFCSTSRIAVEPDFRGSPEAPSIGRAPATQSSLLLLQNRCAPPTL